MGEGLRRLIKHRCGAGWGIDECHGGVRLTRRIAAGKQHKNPRQTVQLGIPWSPAHSGDIFLVVCQIRERMEKGSVLIQTDGHGSEFPEALENPFMGGTSESVSSCPNRFRATALQEIRADSTHV